MNRASLDHVLWNRTAPLLNVIPDINSSILEISDLQIAEVEFLWKKSFDVLSLFVTFSLVYFIHFFILLTDTQNINCRSTGRFYSPVRMRNTN